MTDTHEVSSFTLEWSPVLPPARDLVGFFVRTRRFEDADVFDVDRAIMSYLSLPVKGADVAHTAHAHWRVDSRFYPRGIVGRTVETQVVHL